MTNGADVKVRRAAGWARSASATAPAEYSITAVKHFERRLSNAFSLRTIGREHKRKHQPLEKESNDA
jgi:hypothetical protein